MAVVFHREHPETVSRNITLIYPIPFRAAISILSWGNGQKVSDNKPPTLFLCGGQERSDGQFKPTGFLGVEFRRDLGEAGGDLLEFDGIGEAAVHLGLKVGLLGGK